MKRSMPFAAAIGAFVFAAATFAAPGSTVKPRLYHFTSIVPRGGHAVLEGEAASAHICRIRVYRKGLQMHAEGFRPENPAYGDGRLAWSWYIRPSTKLGRWYVHVDCGSGGSLLLSLKVIPG